MNVYEFLMETHDAKELPWIEKYRPSSFDEIVDQDDKIDTLKKLVDNSELPHLLLSGPPATGKTSTIANLARYMYGPKNYRNYIIDINSSNERGIDTIRERVIQFVQRKSDMVKLVILDEADALTTEAQNALKNVIEKYSKVARFCLICNDDNKITPALHSRCTKLAFTRLNKEAIKKRVNQIVIKEGMLITKQAIDCLIEAENDFRQVLNILQGLNAYYGTNKIESKHVYKYMGKPSDEHMTGVITSLFNDNIDTAIAYLLEMQQTGCINMLDLVRKLTEKIITMTLSEYHKAEIFVTLSDIENKLLQGCSEKILICLLVSSFLKIRSEKITNDPTIVQE